MIFIDTHVAAWLYAGDSDRLSTKAKVLLENNDILISPAAVLELQYLYEINKLTVESGTIVDFLQTSIGLQICECSFHRVISEALPLSWTRDPFDRLITAQAITRNILLVMKDALIRRNCELAVWEER